MRDNHLRSILWYRLFATTTLSTMDGGFVKSSRGASECMHERFVAKIATDELDAAYCLAPSRPGLKGLYRLTA